MAFADGADITADYQFELSTDVPATFLFGAGENNVWLDFVSTAPTNLIGYPDAKTNDVALPGADGAYANPDYQSVRQITLPVIVKDVDTEADLVTAVKALYVAWAPSTVDQQLAFQWPGFGLAWYVGRPRGLATDLSQQRRGLVRVLLRFDCPSPGLVTS